MIPLSYNIRSLQQRRATTLAAVFGIALVVWVLACSLMLSAGVKRTLGSSGKDDQAIVLRKGADNELSSGVESATMNMIAGAPGVKTDNGTPIAVGEIVMVAAMLQKGDKTKISNVQIRGVPEASYRFRPEVRVLEGRLPRPGTDEVIAGARVIDRFDGLEMGKTFDLRKNRPLTVVGVFEADGSSYESEVWVDVDTLKQAMGREGSVSAMRVKLESTSSFEAFEAAIEGDKRLGLEAMREVDYYEKQSEGTSAFITGLGGMISFFFALGAMIGAMITMYASIASRQREIGTLRALGFPRWQILASFVFESTVIAFIGGILGTLAALAMGSVKFSMMNNASFSEIVFGFIPTPAIIAIALAFACVMGLLGGMLPAIQAARMSPVKAMRD